MITSDRKVINKYQGQPIRGKILGCALVYAFPTLLAAIQWIYQRDVWSRLWFLHMTAFLLLTYSVIMCWVEVKPHQVETRIRRFYFCYVLYFMLFMYGELESTKADIQIKGILGLPQHLSLCLYMFIVFLVLYVLIISGMHISEIAVGNTRISMVKEKVEKQLDTCIGAAEALVEKINAERAIIHTIEEYCDKAIARSHEDDGYIDMSQEYQRVLQDYFAKQTEPMNVYVYDAIDENTRTSLQLNRLEYNDLQVRMRDGTIYNAVKNQNYIMVIPYSNAYVDIYIILISPKSIIADERLILMNILDVFTVRLFYAI